MESLDSSNMLFELRNLKAGRPQPKLRSFDRVVPRCCGCFNPEGVADQLPLKHVSLDIKVTEATAAIDLAFTFENTAEGPIETLF
jgi:hypothetical protein